MNSIFKENKQKNPKNIKQEFNLTGNLQEL